VKVYFLGVTLQTIGLVAFIVGEKGAGLSYICGVLIGAGAATCTFSLLHRLSTLTTKRKD
jgi:hypothetical protein